MLYPKDRPDEFRRILGKIKDGEAFKNYMTQRVRKDGTVIDVSISISPVRTPEGEIIGVSTIAREISALSEEGE